MDLRSLPCIELADGLLIHEARTWNARRRGLAGLHALDAGTGLWIAPCRAIHTFGMRFALDLIWLDGDEKVRSVASRVAPRRMRWDPGARSVIEVAAGRGDAFSTAWVARAGGRSAA